MDWSNIVSLAFSAIGCVTGCAALVQTHNANKIAEKSLGVGEEANMLSSESNGLSSDANQIGENANLIAGRSVEVTSNQRTYEWAAQFDAKTGVMAVINDCGFSASDVRVVVRMEDETIGDVHADDVAGFKQVEFELPLVCEKLREETAKRSEFVIGPVFVRLDIYVSWITNLGMHRSIHSKQGFSYTKRKKILS